MRNRWMAVFAVGALALAGACEDEETLFGRYQILVSEFQDTCDGIHNRFGSTLEVRRGSGEEIEIHFGGFPPLTGTFDPEGVLQAEGIVEDDGEGGTTSLRVQVAFFRDGLEGNGRLVFDGTFPDPDVTGSCLQEFEFVGEKANDARAPALPTASDPR
ncbi:MAG: hypothetical protein KY397_07210 [Gemmatimonadetes bacterium]|nr:hypothetical protein [Gemmatimonadota bacterium]